MTALVEPAGKFSMLHPCMHSKFLKNIENTEKFCKTSMQPAKSFEQIQARLKKMAAA